MKQCTHVSFFFSFFISKEQQNRIWMETNINQFTAMLCWKLSARQYKIILVSFRSHTISNIWCKMLKRAHKKTATEKNSQWKKKQKNNKRKELFATFILRDNKLETYAKKKEMKREEIIFLLSYYFVTTQTENKKKSWK